MDKICPPTAVLQSNVLCSGSGKAYVFMQKRNFDVKLDPLTQYLRLDLEQAIGSASSYPPTRLLRNSGTPFKLPTVIAVSRVSAGIAHCSRSRD